MLIVVIRWERADLIVIVTQVAKETHNNPDRVYQERSAIRVDLLLTGGAIVSESDIVFAWGIRVFVHRV